MLINLLVNLHSGVLQVVDETVQPVEIVLSFGGMRILDDSVFRGRDDGGSEMAPIAPFVDGRDVETAEEMLDALQQTPLVSVDDPTENFLVNVG